MSVNLKAAVGKQRLSQSTIQRLCAEFYECSVGKQHGAYGHCSNMAFVRLYIFAISLAFAAGKCTCSTLTYLVR